MSSRKTVGWVVLAFLLSAGCVDPAKRFDEFTGRVVDADTVRIDGSGALFDIDGEFLFTLVPSFAPSNQLRFIATADITIEGATATLDLSIQPISAPNCDDATPGTPVGDPLVHEGLAVDEGGAFEIMGDGAMVAAEANSVTCSPIVADLVVNGQIRSADLFCGDVSGRVTQPTPRPLEGSTFGAIRIEPGTVGDDNLPEPVPACP